MARARGKPFYFIDGPPYTSGHIHLGTAWNKILKDTHLRWRRAKGYNVRDQAGFDMHGLHVRRAPGKLAGIQAGCHRLIRCLMPLLSLGRHRIAD